MPAYTYTRDGQRLIASLSGVALYDTDGTLLTPEAAVIPMDALDLTNVVLDLAMAGWTPVE